MDGLESRSLYVGSRVPGVPRVIAMWAAGLVTLSLRSEQSGAGWV